MDAINAEFRQMLIEQIAIELEAVYAARLGEIEQENERLRGEIRTLHSRLVEPVKPVKETV